MEAKFKFYEIVQIVPEYKNPKIAGKEGAILGMGQDSQGDWFYTVHLYTFKRTWSVKEDALKPTGRTDQRETFYDGTVVKVSVDPVTKQGSLIET